MFFRWSLSAPQFNYWLISCCYFVLLRGPWAWTFPHVRTFFLLFCVAPKRFLGGGARAPKIHRWEVIDTFQRFKGLAKKMIRKEGREGRNSWIFRGRFRNDFDAMSIWSRTSFALPGPERIVILWFDGREGQRHYFILVRAALHNLFTVDRPKAEQI